MKKLRIINACFWAIAAIVLSVLVYHSWQQLGCDTHSLTVGVIVWVMFSIMGWWLFDVSIREANK